MRRFAPPVPRSFSTRLLIGFALATMASLDAAQAQTPTNATPTSVTVGPNVNMGGGPATFNPETNEIIGDPFLQRQNEPSIAVSSRNPCHLLAGANDYRAVDVEEAAGEVGDAWLGVFKSFDCGATWTSTLLPGHKLDASDDGLASPLKGLAAAADATVRAGTNGLFYYSGIAFNRGEGEVGKVFVARFLDNNNKDGGDPVEYLGAKQIHLGTSGQFLDKPWIVADVPRSGSTCTVNGRNVPAGAVYLVYTSFVGGDNNVHSKILFSKSTNCGVTWSTPSKLSERVAKNQGTTIAVDPGTGTIYVAWREFSATDDANSRNAILISRSTNGGQTFTKAEAITPNGYEFQPFDQASSPLTFRTNAYPTMAIVPAEGAGQSGRVYVAWSARGFRALGPGQTLGDARIVISSSVDGDTWTNPARTDSYGDAGHQIMPTLAFAGGKMALAYYDLRDDASGGFDDLVMEYGQQAFEQCIEAESAAGFVQVLLCVLNNATLERRHTLDMRAAIAECEDGNCDWASSSLLGSGKVSRYMQGRTSADGARVQLQYNRPNLPIFSKGKFPFIGDYIDIAGQSFVVTDDGGWAWNTGYTANRPAPVFHVAWADNRNVGTPPFSNPPPFNPWDQFMPRVLGPAGTVVCTPDKPRQVGIRNQDVYTAQLRPGLVVSAPQNSKRITGLQRTFVVVAQNTTIEEHLYELVATPPPGVIASFDQFRGFVDGGPAPLDTIRVTIPRKSSVSRTLFVALKAEPADPTAALDDVLVPVVVTQVTGGTAFDTVYLNPDFENPDFENPDFENPDFENPDFENAELHNPDFENPDFDNPDFENPDFENFTLTASSSIRNPDFENPDFENPDFENPDFENPDFDNPDFDNPDFENPDFDNPDFENGSFQVSDTTFPVRNKGNTTSAYKTNVFVQDAPDDVLYQLIVRKIFQSPAALCSADAYSAQSVPLVNIWRANVQRDPAEFNESHPDFNDPSRDNATFSLGPGEYGIVTLRAYCDPRADTCALPSLENRVAMRVESQAANCQITTAADDGAGDSVKGFTECKDVETPPEDTYDPIPPTIEVPADISVDDSDNSGVERVQFSVSATDNVAVGAVTCSTAASPVESIAPGAFVFGADFPVGTTTVTCTASDIRALPGPNVASSSFNVVVRDVTTTTVTVSSATYDGAPHGATASVRGFGLDQSLTVIYTGTNDTIYGPSDQAPTNAGSYNAAATYDESASSVGSTDSAPFRIDKAASLTVVSCPASVTYDGTAKTPCSASVTGAGGLNASLTVTYAANTNAGTATADATYEGDANHDRSDGSTTFTIGKRAATWTTNANSKVYGELDPIGLTTGSGDFLAAYGVSATYGRAAGEDVGVYPITATLSAAAGVLDNYSITNAGAAFTIGKASSTTVVTCGAGPFTYTGAAHTPCAVAVTGVGGLDLTPTPSYANNLNAGTATASYTFGGDDNHTGSRDSEAFTIGEASSTTLVTCPASVPYNGAAQTPCTVAVTGAGGLSLAPAPVYVNNVNVGTATASYTFAGDANHTGSSDSKSFTVNDTLPPVVTATANPPTLLWSPNKTMTPVTVSGTITDVTSVTALFNVVDEYGTIKPQETITVAANGSYSFVVLLEAWRKGADSNGRVYTINVTATDAGGCTATAQAVVTVPHNQ